MFITISYQKQLFTDSVLLIPKSVAKSASLKDQLGGIELKAVSSLPMGKQNDTATMIEGTLEDRINLSHLFSLIALNS